MKQSNLLAQDNSCTSLMKTEKLESDEQTMLALRQALLIVPLPPSIMMTLTGTQALAVTFPPANSYSSHPTPFPPANSYSSHPTPHRLTDTHTNQQYTSDLYNRPSSCNKIWI